jgi:transposase
MQGEGTGVKKIGGRKVIHSQSREVVIRVYSFMKKEADSGKTINVDRIQTRVSEATGVSVSTLTRILKEHEHNKRVGKEFSTPHKKRPRRKIKTDIDEFDKCVIRRTINEFHITENEHPTLQSLLSVLKKRINFSGGKWALWKIIRDLGFRFFCTFLCSRTLLIHRSVVTLRQRTKIHTHKKQQMKVFFFIFTLFDCRWETKYSELNSSKHTQYLIC